MTDRRIHLRELRAEDWEAVHNYAKLPEVSVYQPWGPNTKEDSLAFTTQAIEDAQKTPRVRHAFGIILNDTGRLAGCAEFSIRDIENRTGEVGYVLHPDVWGKGLATEAAQEILALGFKRHHMHRIFATCEPGNHASQRVLKKIGMTYEGTMREALKLKNGWRDSMLWSILEREYDSEKNSSS